MIELSAGEAAALDALDALLGRGALADPRPRLRVESPGEALLGLGAKRMARAAARWLVEGGGWRERVVLREGLRARGRAWDPALSAGFGLRFTRASLDLWLLGAARMGALAPEAEPEARRAARADLRRVAATGDAAAGDWIVAALAHDLSPALAPREAAAWEDALLRASPLLTLMLARAAPDERQAARLRVAVRSPDARVFECAESRLARAWARAAREAYEERAVAASTRRWTSLAATMRAWCEVVDDARRLDLARPVARAVVSIVEALAPEGPEAARAAMVARVGVRSIASRDALLAAVRGALEAGDWLLRRRGEMAQERYGDDRYVESQVFLEDVDGILAPSRSALRALTQALSARIG
ncbi:MAG: hypothetical protein R3A48_09290 [Polyangiales bacterium]